MKLVKSRRKLSNRKSRRKSVRSMRKSGRKKSMKRNKSGRKKSARRSKRKYDGAKRKREDTTVINNEPKLKKPKSIRYLAIDKKTSEYSIPKPPEIEILLKANRENGLHITNSLTIKKISGPIYMAILVPKTEIIKKCRELTYPIYPPIFILFGDIHESLEYQCKCDEEIFNTCIDEVYKFAEILNKLSSPTYPIDFYLENFISEDDIESHLERVKTNPNYSDYSGDPPLNKLIWQSNECTKKAITSKRYDPNKCLSVNKIRWHLADTRKNDVGKFRIEYFINEFRNYIIELNKIIKGDSVISKYIIRPKTNKTFNDNVSNFKDITDYFINSFPYVHLDFTIYDEIDEYLNILLHICSNDFFDNLAGKSLMYKEYSKFKTNIVDVDIENIIKEDIMSIINNEFLGKDTVKYNINNLNEFIKAFIQLISEYITGLKLNKADNSAEYYSKITNILESNAYYPMYFMFLIDILTYINVYIMDYYFILRSFKKPYNTEKKDYDNNSILNVSYFGAYHSKHIIQLLVDKLEWYNIEFCTENHGISGVNINDSDCVYAETEVLDIKDITNTQYRCITIDKNINLGKMIQELKENITMIDFNKIKV